MNSEKFVEAIKHHVRDAAIADTIANLKAPPGRRVPLQERIRSEWYNTLQTEEAKHVNDVIAIAVHEALFGLLAALDGARTIDDEGGRFKLTYVADESVVLNAPQAASLHELLNAVD
ncbi:hypothetical protein [Bradyrhizobium liaoningense]|uniref:hypothetical protein n=1 Tax=Bradyrhizobium liaoningense TaxID=43992 RepID=UPI001BAC64E0|nr:hypothetical protein [Bradyrhizobium liaoningense]MBR0712094.1 hypothetical protein [Bradyrhizobium liaoningense]